MSKISTRKKGIKEVNTLYSIFHELVIWHCWIAKNTFNSTTKISHAIRLKNMILNTILDEAISQ